jgi:hypothetical protein
MKLPVVTMRVAYPLDNRRAVSEQGHFWLKPGGGNLLETLAVFLHLRAPPERASNLKLLSHTR